VLDALNYVGVFAIEFFVSDGRSLANELAPRVHNSGHWTIEGAETSQFENHVRAVAGLPLGSTAMGGRAVMLNLIGSTPAPDELLALPHAHLHLYGKAARPGRKLGHVTVRADDTDALQAAVNRVEALIRANEGSSP
jgi:5-(carboxyamino)imidazole ribonucleotide synthase